LDADNIDSLVFEYLRLNYPNGWICSEKKFIGEVKRLRSEFIELLKPEPTKYTVPEGWITSLEE